MSAGSHLRLPQALASLGQSAAPIGPIFSRGACPKWATILSWRRPGAGTAAVRRSSAPPPPRRRRGPSSHQELPVPAAAFSRSGAGGAGGRRAPRKPEGSRWAGSLAGTTPAPCNRGVSAPQGPPASTTAWRGKAARPISAVLARCLEYISRSHPTMFLLAVRNFSPSPSLSRRPAPRRNGLRRLNCAGAAASAGAAWWWRVRQDHHIQADPIASRLWFQR